MKKRLIFMFFALTALVCLMAFTVNAANIELTYEVSSGAVTITGYSGSANGTVEIPSTIEGYPVTAIGDWAFRFCSGLNGQLTIPDSVVSIGEYAFQGCSFSSLKLGSGLQTIGDFAFNNCSNIIGELNIPNSVVSIGNSAFENCTGISKITVGSGVTSVGTAAFYGCSGISSIYFYGNIPTFGNAPAPVGTVFYYDGSTTGWSESKYYDSSTSKFMGIYYLKKIPTEVAKGSCGSSATWVLTDDGILEISGSGKMTDYAVSGGNTTAPWSKYKSQIKTLVINSGITYIGNYSFYQFTSLTGKLTLPNSITETGYDVFYGCTGLSGSLELPNKLTKIGASAFEYCTGLTGNLTIPNSVKEIGSYAFSECKNLTGSLTIGSGVNTIGNGAFYNCKLTGNLNIPDSVTSIGEHAFNGSNFSGTLTIGKNVASIGKYAFYGCTGFTGRITLPASVTVIMEYAFFGCSGVTDIYFKGNAPTVYGATASYPSFDTSVVLHYISGTKNWTSNSKWNGYSLATWTGTTAEGLKYIVTTDGVTITGFEGTPSGSLVIPDEAEGYSVTSIGDKAFSECTGFNGTLTIGKNVKSIGINAFYGCTGFNGNLTIPNNVTSIGAGAFNGCSGFNGYLTISENVKVIDSYVFANCNNFDGTLTIPDGVISIGRYAFAFCSKFKDVVVIPKSVTYIDECAFCGFTGITDIYFEGDAPIVVDATEEYPSFNTSITLHFIYGKEDWTYDDYYDSDAGTWRGYKVLCDGEGKTSDGFEFRIINSEVTITGFSGEESGSLVIPDTIEGYPVTCIGDSAFENCAGFEGLLTISANITSIGEYAFEGCSGITDIYFEGDAPSVEEHSFDSSVVLHYLFGKSDWSDVAGSGTWNGYKLMCSIGTTSDGFEYSLENNKVTIKGFIGTQSGSLVIPDTIEGYPVTRIGEKAFERCTGFTGSLSIPDSVTSIGSYAFSGCYGLTGTLTIPDGITVIESSVFNGCIGFTGELTIGNNVTSIGDAAFGGFCEFESLTIGNKVTSIGSMAFGGCQKLTGSVTIPESVTSIGDGAFINCVNITDIYFAGNAPSAYSSTSEHPSFETNIVLHCKEGKTGWTADSDGKWNGYKLLSYESLGMTSDGFEYVISDSKATITDFSGTQSGSLVIPDKIEGYPVTSIGAYAFYECDGFDGSLTIGANVEIIGDFAFAGCVGFTGTVTIPDSVTSIGNYAFDACTALTDVYFQGDAPTVTSYSFGSFVVLHFEYGKEGWTADSDGTWNGYKLLCNIGTTDEGLTYTLWDNKVTITGFSGTQSGSLVIPDTIEGYPVTSIGEKAFYECSGFTGSLTIGKNVTCIGKGAFEYCSGFTGSLTIGANVETIGNRAFFDCTNISGYLTIPDNVTNIGIDAFCYCMKLHITTIGDSVTSIGDYAFYYCGCNSGTYNGSLIIPDRVTSIGKKAFQNTEIKEFYFKGDAPTVTGAAGEYPSFYTTAVLHYKEGKTGWTADSDDKWNGYKLLSYESLGTTYDGFEYVISDSKATITGFSGTQSGSLVIPDTIEGYPVTSIGDYAFYECDGFDGSLTIGANVETIGESAFRECSGFEGSLVIPNSVKSIGNNAFYCCSGFTESLTIPDSVTSIGNYAFQSCSGFTGSLTIGKNVTGIGECAFVYCRGFTGSMTIPDSVTSIGNNAFYACSGFDGSLTIGANVETIGKGAFECCSGLTNVYFKGDAPTVTGATGEYPSFNTTTVLHCKEGKTGWTADSDGTWNGYKLEVWQATTDTNSDGKTNISDAVYLLWAVMKKEGYTLSDSANYDYNLDGEVNSSDAVYLLWHIFYPVEYPIV